MSNKGKYYLTTAIAYTSGKPHIGNVYEIVLADAIARFKRMEGYDVFFQTGTDEHGQKNELKAEAEGVTPKEFVDKVAAIIKEQFDLMNVSYDHFIRTTDDYHEKEVQKIFKYLYDKGDIYKGAYEGLVLHPLRELLDREPARRRQVPRLRPGGPPCQGGSLLLQDEQVRPPAD